MGSAAATLAAIETGASFRATGATNMNDASSRSHAILLLVVAPAGGGAGGGEREGGARARGRRRGAVLLPRRPRRLGARRALGRDGPRHGGGDEHKLGALGARARRARPRRARRRARAHIAYKDSPLTSLLKAGLGGASRTALVACITAADDSLDESLNTLRFAAGLARQEPGRREGRQPPGRG